jgi:hypothetical protein
MAVRETRACRRGGAAADAACNAWQPRRALAARAARAQRLLQLGRAVS